jgi:hypothetical protein
MGSFPFESAPLKYAADIRSVPSMILLFSCRMSSVTSRLVLFSLVLARFPLPFHVTCSKHCLPQTLFVGFHTLPCWVSESNTEKYKKDCNINKNVIAISHPDQWGFGEWLGQTPRLVLVPKVSYYYYYKGCEHIGLAGAARSACATHSCSRCLRIWRGAARNHAGRAQPRITCVHAATALLCGRSVVVCTDGAPSLCSNQCSRLNYYSVVLCCGEPLLRYPLDMVHTWIWVTVFTRPVWWRGCHAFLLECLWRNMLALDRRRTDKPTLSRSQGRHAYPSMRAADIRACVLGGRRPPMAAALHPDIAHIIGRCWSQSATARPPFSLIIMLLEAVQQSLHDSADAVTNAEITTTIFRQ